MKRSLRALCLALALVAASPSQAVLIFWGSVHMDTLLNSDGMALDASFRFDLGRFETGFTPSTSNMDQWAANWVTFASAVNGDGWDPIMTEVNTSVNHTSASGSDSPYADPLSFFAQGDQAYLWVYNSQTISSTSEWALLYDTVGSTGDTYQDWTFPDPNDQSSSIDWQFRDLDIPVFGAVNNVQGPGDHSASPGTFTIQTHAVPEPGTALLLGVVGILLNFRRKRRA